MGLVKKSGKNTIFLQILFGISEKVLTLHSKQKTNLLFMKTNLRHLMCTLALATSMQSINAQSILYPQTFNLQEITLGDGVFNKAMQKNDELLLQYDVDRLLTPFFRQAGMNSWATAHPNFSNWGSGSFRLDGHVGGHYLSALALAYAASHDEAMKAKMKERLDYMVNMIDSCQKKFDTNTTGLYGYIGGLPDNTVWTKMYSGDISGFNSNRGNVPFYVQHKILAGLRDAYIYGGNEKAYTCFLKLCDWTINVVSKLSTTTMQSVLDTEHGGVNETLLDAYQLTGELKYLEGAKKYSHTTMITGLQTLNTTFLDGKHANTQVPKYIGFERIAQQDAESADATLMAQYRKAALNFWTDVTTNRTVCIGGNSISEHFLAASNASKYIMNSEGPESCNTNNMLKLSEDLFADTHDAKYADFYEKAMINHILSTQNPTTGGYVYFTSLRPQDYRIYSQVNQGMWCCVGTGMENHSKYGHFAYTHKNDTLFVNLYMPSTLNSDKYGIEQTTKFPYEQKSELKVTKAGKYAIAVRYPGWCEGFEISINGTKQDLGTSKASSYIYLNRTWKEGDIISVSLPMHLSMTACPNYTDYVSFSYGPVLLGAKTTTNDLSGEFAGEGRMDHSLASVGKQYSLTSAPMLIGNRTDVLGKIKCTDQDSLYFSIDTSLYNNEKWANLRLQPFFTIHEARYMVYWNQLTEAKWNEIKAEVEAEENEAQDLSNHTLDFVATGEQQSDAGHGRIGTFETGSYDGEYYIDAQKSNWFSYQLETKGESDSISLMCRYHGADKGRKMTIYIDDVKFQSVELTKSTTGFYNILYNVDPSFLKKADGKVKDTITVKFAADQNTVTPGVYYIRLLHGYNAIKKPHYSFVNRQWISGDAGRVKSISYNDTDNTMTITGYSGNNNIAPQFSTAYDDQTYVSGDEKYLLVEGTPLLTGSGKSYLWWLNGKNAGSQVAPTYEYTDATTKKTYIIWDVTKSGLDAYMNDDINLISSNGNGMSTIFGLTANGNNGQATISDINWYTAQEAVDKYNCLASTFGLQPSGICNISSSKDSPKQLYDMSGHKTSASYRGIVVGKKYKAIKK